MSIAFRDSKPFPGEVRTRFTADDQAKLDELIARKAKAYEEGAEAIRLVIMPIDMDGPKDRVALALIPFAAALRDALAVFDDRTAGEGRR